STMLEDLLQCSTSASLLGVMLLLLLFHLFQSSFSSREQNREPPGPRAFPLLGNLLQLDLKRLDKLSKKYGPVFTVYLGPQKVVVLAGYRAVKQALVSHAVEFGNREITPVFHDFNQGHGILFSNGDSWREMRRFALTTLKDFGMGRRISEGRITEECQYLIEEFEQHKGKPFSNAQAIHYAASNIISTLMFGKRFDYDDPVLRAMVEADKETIHLTGSASIMIYNVFPWLGPFLKNWRILMKNVENNKSNIRRIIADLKGTLNPDMCRCFVDAFLIRQQHPENSHYHDDNMLYSVINLFAAGTDTTGHSLQWCLLFMAKYPHIQEQVQEELSRVVGSRQVRMEDRKKLPFTDAVIHESQRLANIVPMALPHTTSQDVTFQGYFIRKVSWSPLFTLKAESLLVSSADFWQVYPEGRRRACLGEGLARMELFLFFTSLLQRFRFTAPPGVSEDELDLTPLVGFTLSPSPQELCAVSRQ
uniref:Cytochrome P450 2K1-like n=1 Tax=Stegastes partitus TaxID=144197 RepID=A0A3B4ZWG4_9TELE